VTSKDEYLFLKTDRHSVEFTLLAEGFRKLALIWLLIKNGSLSPGAILFWDEPESSLNPSLLKKLIEIILGIGRQGVQVFIATHNYIVLKEFDIQATDADRINYHSLYREKKTKPIECNTSDKFSEIHPNVILDVFTDIYDREIDRVLKGDK
jgi:AAA15 family ATPase/GTPase